MKCRAKVVSFNYDASKGLDTKKYENRDIKDDDSSTPIGCFIFLFFIIFLIAIFGIIIGGYMEAWRH